MTKPAASLMASQEKETKTQSRPTPKPKKMVELHTGLALLDQLDEGDWDWIFENGIEEQVIANTQIIHEGEKADAVYFVLEGLVGVFIKAMGDKPLAKLGPGEIFGEIAFLKDQAAVADVRAVENSLLLGIPWTKLQLKLEEDTSFAVGFYRAISLMNVDRLKRSVSTLGRVWDDRVQLPQEMGEKWQKLGESLDQFKALMVQADKEAIKNHGEIDPEMVDAIHLGFEQLSQFLNQFIGNQSSLSDVLKNEIGARVQREILPYILLSDVGERMYSKPRGYAGDFLTIEIMYRNQASGTGRLGPIIDRAVRKQKANLAVMNRRGLLATAISDAMAHCQDEVTRVTSLASGPAAELFDVYSTLEDKTVLKATCIDIDLQALAFVGDKRDQAGLRRLINLHNGNLVYLATGRQKMDLPPQDLIYSIGLIDYFSDKFVVMLLNYVHKLLKPGGKVILGNFHPDNPTKALMDHVLDWKLIHRDEADMHRLFQASAFASSCSRIQFEDAGVNLFAECIKA